MKIAIVSDTHFSSADTILEKNWRAVQRWIEDIKPDFVVHLGDITADGAHAGAEFSHARALLAGSGAEIVFVPGNHDIGDHPAGPGLTTDEPLNLMRLQEYRSVFGPDYWSRSCGRWQFIALNAPLMFSAAADEEERQFAWLAETLRSGEGPLGVFLHKPLFRDDAEEDIVHTRYVPQPARRRLLDLLATRDLRFVAAGHTHQVRQFAAGDVEHIWAPSTAFTISDFRQERIGEKLVGVMMLDIEGDAHRFTHVIPAGMGAHDLMEFEHIYPAVRGLKQAPAP